MSKPIISVIIPVYNAELYLKRCLDSVVGQTYEHLEIILVDDASTDNSYSVCSEYSSIDSRIILLQQKNSGQSFARNKGLEAATGTYVMFVDADDWLDTNACSTVLDAMIQNDPDVVLFTYSREYEGASLRKNIFDGNKIFDEQDCKAIHRRFAGIIGKELSNPENSDSLAPVWNKLYKRSIIQTNNILFEDVREIVSYEDGLFNLHYFMYVKKAIYLDVALYKYWRSNLSSTTKTYYEDLIPKFKALFSKIDLFISQHHLPDEYKDGLSNRIALNLITVSLKTVSNANPLSFSEKNKYLKRVLDDTVYKNAVRSLKIEYMPVHWKLYFLCARFKCSFLLLLLSFAIKYRINRNS